ncbi:hypothetical protein S83_032082, partial [Arachis hypogaea]
GKLPRKNIVKSKLLYKKETIQVLERENGVAGEDAGASIGDQLDLSTRTAATFVSTAEAPNLRPHMDRPLHQSLNPSQQGWRPQPYLERQVPRQRHLRNLRRHLRRWHLPPHRHRQVPHQQHPLLSHRPRRHQNTLLQRRPDSPAVGEVPRRHEHRRHGRGSLRLPGAAQDLSDRVPRPHGNEDKAPPEEAKPKPAATALKEWNGVRELAGNKGLTASGFLCCLVARRSIQLTPTNPAMERATPPDSRLLHGKAPLGDEASRGFRGRYHHYTVVGKPVL